MNTITSQDSKSGNYRHGFSY